MEQQFTTKFEYSKRQVGILTKAMLIAGLCFGIVCGGAWGFSILFTQHIDAMIRMNQMWLPIFLLMMLVSMIISMLWIKALSQKKSAALTVIIYLVYMSLMSVAFGYIFALVRNYTDAKLLPLAFGITGGIFLLAALMAKLLSIKGVFTFGKLIGACSIAMSILLIVNLILGIVGTCVPSFGIFSAADATFMLIMIGLSVIIFGYMVIDMWQISKSEEFFNFIGEGETPSTYIWYCGYRLLVDLLNVLLIVIWFLLRFFRKD